MKFIFNHSLISNQTNLETNELSKKKAISSLKKLTENLKFYREI